MPSAAKTYTFAPASISFILACHPLPVAKRKKEVAQCSTDRLEECNERLLSVTTVTSKRGSSQTTAPSLSQCRVRN
jgi:hypothetical protein